eukprot:CAMPEP_0197912260 /NCGR_PEP_ID=MMETSP1439-20131203/74440_1 /TAXON_ID=66791 /ORGANISM="Gonyaulax spinifera, Strain CCMP409" /LENGTH=31 /DNA_ID= /DNA_START= /DNA_END= /DNA_ORIENTATION=
MSAFPPAECEACSGSTGSKRHDQIVTCASST